MDLQKEIDSMIRTAIAELKSPSVRSKLLGGLINPICQRRRFFSMNEKEEGLLWLFYVIPSRKNIALAYSSEGYGLKGSRWGLVFVDSSHYGDSDAWYDTLNDLLRENELYFT